VYWLPTPFASFPFTSPPVSHRVPSHFNWSLLQFFCLRLKFCTWNYVQIAGLGLTLHISWILFDGAEFVLHNFEANLLYSCENCTGCHTVNSPFSKSTFSTFCIRWERNTGWGFLGISTERDIGDQEVRGRREM